MEILVFFLFIFQALGQSVPGQCYYNELSGSCTIGTCQGNPSYYVPSSGGNTEWPCSNRPNFCPGANNGTACRALRGCYCDEACIQNCDCCSNYCTICIWPTINSVTPSTIPTQGQSITIAGRGFGISGTVTLRGSSVNLTCPSTGWTQSQIICTAPAGYDVSWEILISALFSDGVTVKLNTGKPGYVPNYLNYGAPSITSITPSTIPTTGGTVVMTGANFGLRINPGWSLTVGGVTVANATITDWQHTQITFPIAAGEGAGIAIQLTTRSGSDLKTVSYAVPVISSISPTNGPTTGNNFLIITGSNYGTPTASVSVSIGTSACTINSRNHTFINCTTPAGYGSSSVKVLVAQQINSDNFNYRYDGPFVSSVTPLTGRTVGGYVLTIVGSNFANNSATSGPIVNIGGLTGCSSFTFNSTVILCTIVSGQGSSLAVQVVASGGQSSSQTFLFSYSSPSISNVLPASFPTQGNINVTIIGDNFGTSATASVSGTPCNILSQNHTQIICNAPAGSGLNSTIIITVGVSASNAFTFPYSPPTITSLNPLIFNTSGGDILTITGTNFGASIVTGSVTLGGSVCSPTGTQFNHSNIVCSVPAGEGLNRSLVININGQSISSTLINYRAPTLDSVSPANGPTGGNILITLSGWNFGVSTPNVVVGGVSCPVNSRSHFSLVCTLPAGSGNTTTNVTVLTRTTNSIAFTYDRPLILAVSSADSNPGATSGGASLTIIGSSFGTNGTITLGGTNCPVTAWSHTQVVCTIPAGQGTNLDVRVTVTATGYTGVLVGGFSGYNAPAINSITPQSNLQTSGGINITISGLDFGLSPSVTIGGQSCTVRTFSHTQIICTIPGGSGAVSVFVLVGVRSSNGFIVNYGGPAINSLVPSNGPAIGGYNLTVNGANFANTSTVSINSLSCPVNGRAVDGTSLTCILPGGTGQNLQVQVSTGTQFSNIAFFSYDRPTISNVINANGPTIGNTNVTIIGSSFSASGTITIGSTTYTPSFYNDSRIILTTVAGEGRNLIIQVTVASRGSNTDYLFNYDSPVLNTITPSNGPTNGGAITLSGQNFGLNPSVLINSQSCSISLRNHTSITCTISAGSGRSQPVTVTVASITSNSQLFNFDAPVITGFNPTSIDTSGGLVPLTIQGRNFGTTGTATIGGSLCIPTSTGFSHTTIVCVPPAGQGAFPIVNVTVGGQFTTSNTIFTYTPPSISSFTPTSGSTGPTGSYQITLSGSSFGLTSIVSMGGQPCVVSFQSHSQVVFAIVAGRGTVNINITAGGQVSNSVSFSYNSPLITGSTSSDSNFGRTSGNFLLTILGQSFDTGGSVILGGSTCSVQSWSHSQVICQVAPGQGTGLTVVLTTSISLLSNTQTNFFSYNPPVITSATANPAPTVGNVNVTVSGIDFGLTPIITFTTGNCPIILRNHTYIICTLPIGEGFQSLSLAVGGQTSPSVFFQYNSPIISSISPTTGVTSGGYNLTLSGSNFGLTATVSIGSQTCLVVQRSSQHNQLICTVPAGTGVNQAVKVTVSTQVSNTILFTYLGPQLNLITPPNGPTSGNINITLSGTSFGTSGTVTVNSLSCPVVTYADTQIVCVLPIGSGVSQSVQVVSGVLVSNNYGFDYDPPVVTSITPSNGPTGGSIPVTVRGNSFSLNGIVLIGGQTCSTIGQATHTQIICDLPSGEGLSKTVNVRVGARTSNSTTFNYDLPSISSITPANGPTSGGTTITFQGISFSVLVLSVTIGGSACPIVANSASYTSLRCILPAGQGRPSIVNLTTAQGSITNSSFNYDTPVISSVAPTNGPTSGGVLTVFGSNFGLLGAGNVTVGGVLCPPTGSGWSHTRIECSYPEGTGTNRPVVVTVVGQASPAASFNYDPPTLTSLSPANGPAGGTTLTLFGTNFGNSLAALSISVTRSQTNGGTLNALCTPLTAAHVNVTCTLPATTGSIVAIAATVSSQLSETRIYRTDRPVITRITGCTDSGNSAINCPTNGGQLVTIIGDNFGALNATLTSVFIADLQCTSATILTPQTRIRCSLPARPQGGYSLSVIVTIDGQTNIAANLLSYSGPEIIPNSLFRSAAPGTIGAISISSTTSTETVEFLATGLGSPQANNMTITYGTTSNPTLFSCISPQITVVNATVWRLKCQLVSGVGQNLVFQVASGLQTSLPGVDTLTYPQPIITPSTIRTVTGTSGFTTLRGTSTEGQRVVFDGLHFGAFSNLLTVSYGPSGGPYDSPCLVITSNNTNIVCQTGPGIDGPYFFQVNGLNQLSAVGTDRYFYPQAPVVFAVTGCLNSSSVTNTTSNCPTAGGTTITVIGQNFAVSNDSTSVRVDGNNCQITRFVDDSQLECRLPAGRGASRSVVVVSGALFSRDVFILSYAAPFITSITGCPGATASALATTDCDRAGNTLLTIQGTNFGFSPTELPVVLVGGSSCTSITQTSTNPNYLTCSLPAGSGQNLAVIIINRQISSNSASLSYLLCPAGTAVNGTSCSSCPRGSFSDQEGAPQCTECDAGYFSNTTGATFCGRCTEGYYSQRIAGTGATVCQSCLVGYYAPLPGMAGCLSCPIGKFADRNTSITCDNCPTGYAASNLASQSCAICSPGTYAGQVASVTCYPCLAGTYQNASGASFCSSCDPGYVQPSSQQTQCIQCPTGQVIGTSGQATCQSCESGYYANATAMTACLLCSAGKTSQQQGSNGPTGCTDCPIGQYINIPGQATCLLCDKGSFGNSTGSTFCYKCIPGTFSTILGGSQCQPCPAGSFTSQNGLDTCTSCPEGRYANGTANIDCTLCPIGTYQPDIRSSQCLPCPTGTASNIQGQISCINCIDGSYASSTGFSSCQRCDAGYFSAKRIIDPYGPTSCSQCQVGTIASVELSSSCTPCDPGWYSANNASTLCQKCPPGTSSSSSGASTCQNCTAGRYSPDTASLSCIACPSGSYSNVIQASVCTLCQAGYAQSQTGQTFCQTCLPGFFSDSAGAGTCSLCPAGRISTANNSQSCVSCGLGKYQPLSGKSVCIDCAVGTFASAQGQLGCVDCEQGKYTNVSGSADCIQCPAGTAGGTARLSNCIACTPGYYASGTGTIACIPALAGTFVSTSSATAVQLCSVGFVQPLEAQSSCLPCGLGKFAGAQGLAVCTDCSPGSYAPGTNYSVCLPCDAGRFSGQGVSQCTACDVGKYGQGTGRVSCDDCPPGTVQNITGQSLCNRCHPGTESLVTGGTVCTPCARGSANAFGAQPCVACGSGFYTNTTGAQSCVPCEQGRSTSSSGSIVCSPCNSGYFQASTGQALCVACAIGTYQASQGSTACELCNAGSYGPGQGLEQCLTCAAGRAAAIRGSVECAACQPGTYALANASLCTSCNVGYAQPLTERSSCSICPVGSMAPSVGLAQCLLCPLGKYANSTGLSYCADCNPGTYQRLTGQGYCDVCPAGTFARTSGSFACEQCPSGEISTDGAVSCTKCPLGQFSPTSSLGRECFDCPEGKYSIGGAFECTSCPIGFYSNRTGASSCDACAPGKRSASLGLSQCEDCPIGRAVGVSGASDCPACGVGRFGNTTGLATCTLCPRGTASFGGLSFCPQCDAGKYSSTLGSIICTDCVPGFYSSSSGVSSCLGCEPGYYQASNGKQTCDECPTAKYTETSGFAACVDCPAGRFGNFTGVSSCSSCSVGSYSLVGQRVCTACETGKYQNSASQSSCLQCPLGRYGPTTGLENCLSCPGGTHSDRLGALGCSDCQVGEYSFSVDTISCSKCPTGSFQPNTSSTSCASCSAAKYQNIAGMADCSACKPGTFADFVGSAACATCPTGKYTNDSGLSGCYDCLPGFYQSTIGQQGCLECPVGRFTDALGQPSCAPCPAGSYQNTTGKTLCELCELGFYQDQNEAIGCITCPNGTFGQGLGQLLCSECVPGKFNNQSGKLYDCEPCPIGTAVAATGATVCPSCPKGRFIDVEGQSACNPCPAGKFGNVTGLSDCSPCPAGTFAGIPGSENCTVCQLGRYSTEIGADVCTECPQGKFLNRTGVFVCDSCTKGFYQDASGSSACKECGLGEYSDGNDFAQCTQCAPGYFTADNGSLGCEQCPQGKYASTFGSSNCTVCPVGKFSTRTGAIVCSPCRQGRFMNLTGSSVDCSACPIGTSQPETGMSVCLQCGLGRFAGSPGADLCTSCSSGRYANRNGSSACELCPVGFAQPQTEMSICDPCPIGRASGSIPGQAICPQCPEGRYANDTGFEICTACSIGTYQSQIGATNCTLCEIGRYGPIQALPRCVQCLTGTYGNRTGLTLCDDCERGLFGPTSGLTRCEECDVGTQSPTPALSLCEPCPAGKIAPTNGTISCEACLPGYFSINLTTCMKCNVGSASDQTGAAVCTPCAPGKFTNLTGQLLCQSCDAGYYQNRANSTECTLCPEGKYASASGQEFCIECGFGKYNLLQGAITCDDCAPRYYKNWLGVGTCQPCPQGRYGDIGGLELCASCQTGKYAPNTTNLNCYECQPGFIAEQPGLTGCAACEKGKFAQRSGSDLCSLCRPGFFSNTNSSTLCDQCPPGKFADVAGSANCTDCAINRFSLTGGASCSLCPGGRYGNRTGQIQCPVCRAGYSSTNGQTTCKPCDIGQTSSEGGVCLPCPDNQVAPQPGMAQCIACTGQHVTPSPDRSRCLCTVGYYFDPKLRGPDFCLRCPFGADCDLNGTTIETLKALEGFWRADNQTVKFYNCMEYKDCVGGGAAACRDHHVGPLCAVCEDGYYRRVGGICAECPKKGLAVISFVFITIAVFVALLAQFYLVNLEGRKKLDEAKRRDEVEWEGEEDFDFYEAPVVNADAPPHTPPAPPSSLYKFKIGLGFAQIMSNLSFAVDIPWPKLYRRFVSVFSILNFDLVSISSVECVFNANYFAKFLFFGFAPIGIALLIAAGYLLPKYLGISWEFEKTAPQKKSSRRRFWRMFIFALFLIYPTVSSTIVRLYVCKDVAGIDYMVVDYSIRCFTPEWNTYAIIGAFLVILYPIGIPIYLGHKIFAYRDRLNEPGVKAMFGILYHGYFNHVWWFEFIDMAHKLYQVALLAFFPIDLQLGAGMVGAIGYLILILVISPYVRKGDDRLHSLAQVELFMFYLSAYVFRLDQKWDPVIDVFLSILFMTLASAFLGFLVAQLVMIVFKRLVEKFSQFGERIAPYSKKVAKWVMDGTQKRQMTIEEMNEIAAKKRRTDDEVRLNRNPLYHPTTSLGLHTVLGDVNLTYNPMNADARLNAELEIHNNFTHAAVELGEAPRPFVEGEKKEAFAEVQKTIALVSAVPIAKPRRASHQEETNDPFSLTDEEDEDHAHEHEQKQAKKKKKPVKQDSTPPPPAQAPEPDEDGEPVDI